MKSQKKLKKFDQVDSKRNKKSNNLVSILTRSESNNQQQVEIFVAENSNSYDIKHTNSSILNKLLQQLCLLFEKKLKFCELLMILLVFFSLICYNLLLVYSLQKELNQIRIEFDKLTLNANSKLNESSSSSAISVTQNKVKNLIVNLINLFFF